MTHSPLVIIYAMISIAAAENISTDWFVIVLKGAGLGRTGTDSLKHALELLGMGPAYHMKDALRGHPCTMHHIDGLWTDASKGNVSPERFRSELSCFRSGVDIPAAAYFQELMQAYPNAKVVLTRRRPLQWARSAQSTICPAAVSRGAIFEGPGSDSVPPLYVRVLRTFLPVAPGTGVVPYRAMMSGVLQKIAEASYSMGGENSASAYCSNDTKAMAKLYESWNAYVMKTVPSERLIVFDTGIDGWDKLCDGLNVSVPRRRLPNGTDIMIPYPHINTRADYVTMVFAQRVLACIVFVTPILLCVLAYLLCRKCCWRSKSQYIHID